MIPFACISRNPEILGGKPIIRISVAFIIELVATGASIGDIIKKYPHLKEVEVRQALLFARNN